MMCAQNTIASSETDHPWLIDWALVPAVVMSLGWGLRGYIGGGPFGAMIPGALIALVFCLNLGYGARSAAVVTAFGAIGFGFGGEMTYGQTLGLLRSGESFWWGLLGTTLKGAVWGLLGGAVFGLGFIKHRLSHSAIVLALLCLLLGVAIGLHFINQPKLVYFSDPIHRPRDESWAGFLLGAAALLAYLWRFQPRASSIASTFAQFGALGGALGFGGGSLLLAMQPHLPSEWRWLPCWKFMEFSFGAALGAALGLAARRSKPMLTSGDLPPLESGAATYGNPGKRNWISDAALGGVIVAAVFCGWVEWIEPLDANCQGESLLDPRRALARTLLGFTGLGCVLLVLSHRNEMVAWQTAISVTIVAAAIDWQRDLLPRGQIEMAPLGRSLFVVAFAALSAVFVAAWRKQQQPRLHRLLLFSLCVLMAIAYLMGLAWHDLWWPDAAATDADRAQQLWQRHRSEVVVHAIFTGLFAFAVAWTILRAKTNQKTIL